MERPEFNIRDKNLDDKERGKVVQYYENRSQRGFETMEGELKKSPETLQFIETINGYLNEELEAMGLDEAQLDAQRIHVLTAEGFAKNFPHLADVNGVYSDDKDGIYVEQDKSRLQTYKSMLHEVIHQLSYKAIAANPEIKETYVVRSGYANIPGTEEHHEHFRGLNEAVIDSIVKEVFRKHADELIKDFNITKEEQREPVSYYDGYIHILNIIMDKIVEKKGEDKTAVWGRFKKGEFTGEMMHLREVERTFGNGALRVLAALGSGTKTMKRSKVVEKMEEYFQTDDAATQEKIAKEILIERERLRYGESQE
jgi:hypothetical protein